MEYVLPRRGKRCNSPAVEAVFKGYNIVTVNAVSFRGVFAGNFYGAFVCFRTRIAEKHLSHTRGFAQKFGKLYARIRIEYIGHVLNAVKLCFYRFRPYTVASAECVYGDARTHIYILTAVAVVQKRAFTLYYFNGKARICTRDVIFIPVL